MGLSHDEGELTRESRLPEIEGLADAEERGEVMPLRAPKDKNWIEKAIKHPGSETAAAQRHGVSTHQEAEKESGSASPSIRKRGTLALTLAKMHK